MKPGIGRRTISLDDRVIEQLRRHRTAQAREQLKAARWAGEGWVFTTSVGTPLDHRNDHRRLQKLLKEAGVRPLKVHALRHTFASFSVLAGVDSRVTKQVTGWKTDAMLMRYTHIQDESTKQAATAILNEMLGVAKAAGIELPDGREDNVAELKAKFLAFVEAL